MRTPHRRPRKSRVTLKKGAAAASSKTAAKDTSTWLTRHETSAALTISEQTLANYERRGFLHPGYDYRRDRHGIERRVIVYEPSEITKIREFRPYRHVPVAPRPPGETDARAVELFREGKSDEEVIVELRLTFDRVDELRQKWIAGGGRRWVIEPQAWKALNELVGGFGDMADLVEQLTKLLKPTTVVTSEPVGETGESAEPELTPRASASHSTTDGSSAEGRDADTSRAQGESPSEANAGLAIEPAGDGPSTAMMSPFLAQSAEASTNHERSDRAGVRPEIAPGSEQPRRAEAGGASKSRDVGLSTGAPEAMAPESREPTGDLVAAPPECVAAVNLKGGASGAAPASSGADTGLHAARAPREQLLDAWLHSLYNDDARQFQRLAPLLFPAEIVMIADLALNIGNAAPPSAPSPREQMLDALIASLKTDEVRLEQIVAALNEEDVRDMFAELRNQPPRS